MNILAIDTTTENANIAFLIDDTIFVRNTFNKVSHSEKLLPLINDSLMDQHLTLDNISLLAAINGPGSFTGIRIGLATIKAFAQVKDLPIFSVSSIELIAYTALEKINLEYNNYMRNLHFDEITVLSLIDAKNSRVYYGINKVAKNSDGKVTLEKIKEVGNNLIDDILPTLKEYDNLVIAGNCVNTFKEKLLPYSEQLLDFYPNTGDLIECYSNLKEEDRDKYMYNAYSLDAFYARPSQAERMAKNNGK